MRRRGGSLGAKLAGTRGKSWNCESYCGAGCIKSVHSACMLASSCTALATLHGRPGLGASVHRCRRDRRRRASAVQAVLCLEQQAMCCASLRMLTCCILWMRAAAAGWRVCDVREHGAD